MTNAAALLAAFGRPIESPRVTCSHWDVCDSWGVYVFEGGTQLAGGMGRTLAEAFEACERDARRAPSRDPPRERSPRSAADLLG